MTSIEDVRGPVRVERCACGGIVAADPLYPTEGVRVHQQTEAHRCWQMRGGLEPIDLWWAERGLLVERRGGSVVSERPFGYNERVGISDATTNRMCDALPVADTSRRGVSRLEVSAP